jgi:NhaP-type Na+/H+ or K+/H+ antiporter
VDFAIWALIIGALLIVMALAGTFLERLPISTAMLYLAAGFGLGPAGLALMEPDPIRYSVLLERVAEVAVLISLFAVGLKLGLPFSDTRWQLPLRLAVLSMIVTVGLIALVGVVAFGLSLGAAVLLGAILAPTDPVLASDVQVNEENDRDRLRFSLSGEGGLNDGAAFPFVMLGLGLLGLHDLGTGGWRWVAVDVLWATLGGLVIGAVAGAAVGRFVIHLRSQHKMSVGLDEFLALGLIALAYGIALLCHTYGFLAVLAAGIALQRVQGPSPGRDSYAPRNLALQPGQGNSAALATDSAHAGAYLMREVRDFNQQLERIVEVAVVLVIGAMLAYVPVEGLTLVFVAVLLLIVRPLAVWLGLLGAPVSREQRLLISWFGIRGIGSVYYLMYAVNHGLPETLAERMIAITLTVVASSVVLHGISVTPLMKRYRKRTSSRQSMLRP